MNVSFIGSGNLAWHLAPVLDNTEYAVKEVYSLHAQQAEALVKRLYHAKVQSTLDFSASPSRIFFIAVSDDVIAEIAQEIILPDDAILLHTSGSQPMNVLAYAAASGLGVFYPLQTFTKNRKVDFSEIPIFVESEDPEAERQLLTMGKAISKKVFTISSAERQALHVAAVFASNFTNHMLTISRDILSDNKLDFEWLKPLIAETINKALSLGPDESQTGPAKRGDLEILDRHLGYLSRDEAVAEIYRIISQHILDRYDE
ncbi:MAG: Rossmann-like and DUF2520 domain-containing protein [Cyclobacteriaceae bacterium]